MREFALIVENPDGFDDLANKIRHALAESRLRPQRPTTRAGRNATAHPCPPFTASVGEETGPRAAGSLREFAIGAVIQHAPLTLGRVEGVDFRLPTDEELDALEAFQLSLGRQEEIEELDRMEFTDARRRSPARLSFCSRTRP